MDSSRGQPWGEKFSRRELEIVRLVSKGLSNRDIAHELQLSIETVKWYNKQLFMKLRVRNRVQAANRAVELDLLGSEGVTSGQEEAHLPGNLPSQLTSFVGRKEEITEIKELSRKNRLIVLTGAGGSGKTRLALKVGEELQDEFDDGVWLVDLANIHVPALVLQAVAGVLRVSESADASLSTSLKHYLSRKHLLLLLDNLEHLLECAPLIGDLLAVAPKLSVIGTSRESLHIYGEQEYPVQPLDLPDNVGQRTIEELKNVESVALFIERARAVRPAFSPDDDALEDLARICLRLDGLPLAIELCAPMVKVFSPGAIADRIERSLDAIPSGPRDLPDRQRALRDAIQWSFDLLDENEKQLFDRLAVFNGGGTIQAVTAICGERLSGNIENTLSALVNKNLVLAQERQDGEIHFVMLETIRRFARDRLLASREAKLLTDRHTRYFLQLAKKGTVELRGPDQIVWMARYIVLQDNMREALKRAIGNGEAETALDLVCSLAEFWLRHSDYEEGRWWIEQAMALPDVQQYRGLYLEAFNNLSWLSWLQDNESLDARKMAEQALRLAQSQSDSHNAATALLNLGMILVHQDEDSARGLAYLGESKALFLEVDDKWGVARALMDLAVANFRYGEYSSARPLYFESLGLFKELGDILFQCIVTRLIGDLEAKRNNLTGSAKAYEESLTVAREVKSSAQIAYNFWGLARVEKARGNHASAVRWYLIGKRVLEDIGAWSNRDDPELNEEFTTARTVLGGVEFQSAWDSGLNMPMEEAIRSALSEDIVLPAE